MLNLLDEHCSQWNEYLEQESHKGEEPISAFDFFYLVPRRNSTVENRRNLFSFCSSPNLCSANFV